jgi:Bifunctional DNA primase/polymerase, N-terminal
MSVDAVMSRNLEVACRLAAAGCAVFPCDPVSGDPLVEWRAGSTTDIAALDALWQRYPDAVPAIDLGKAGLLVVEPRYRDDDDKARNGFKAFEQLARDHGWDIVTSAVRSPDGLHYYFRQPEGEPLESLASLGGHNIEIHGKGGYVIGPNVVRGVGWDWLPSSDTSVLDALAQHTVPVAPAWLAALIRRERDLGSGPAGGARARRPIGRSCRVRRSVRLRRVKGRLQRDVESNPAEKDYIVSGRQ